MLSETSLTNLFSTLLKGHWWYSETIKKKGTTAQLQPLDQGFACTAPSLSCFYWNDGMFTVNTFIRMTILFPQADTFTRN